MPLFVGLVVIAEIAFLGRLDMAKKADLVNSWADSFYKFTTSSRLPIAATTSYDEAGLTTLSDLGSSDTCEEWLEKEDSVAYARDFHKEPIFVTGAEQVRFLIFRKNPSLFRH